jgi:hypothetical protein
MTAPPGWYDDPHEGGRKRWWDGHEWTGHVSSIAEPPPNGDLAPELVQLRREYELLKAQVAETREIVLLQEVGLYAYAHPLDASAEYSGVIKEVQGRQAEAVKGGTAVLGTDRWAINGSQKEGAKMVSDFCKLLLRAYNTEADNLVRGMKPYGRDAAVERLEKMRVSISKLGSSMKIHISDEYHALKVNELELTSDYRAKLEEEKERAREEKARLREEAAARREFELEQARLEKERQHYLAAVQALRNKGDTDAAAAAEEKLSEVEDAIKGVSDRVANIRAGYVYVISNIGAFGDRIVKIGMTRRLNPMERVEELGDASVPFRFDVHCIIFSQDAVGLETSLHQRFAQKKVNHVNLRREFFFVTPLEVKVALQELQGQLLSFEEAPEALEWHQSQNILRSFGSTME